MTNILDQLAARAAATKTQFVPTTRSEFLALRIAQRLTDEKTARYYAELADSYGDSRFLTAFRRIRHSGAGSDQGRHFHIELERLAGRPDIGRSDGYSHHRLAGIRIERRAVAIAIFSGEHLDSVPVVRQLSSDSQKAVESAAAFITRMLDRRPFIAAALETIPGGQEVQRALLSQTIVRILHERGVSLWHVPKREVISAFGQPPLRFRNQVRDVITSIFPEVNGSFGGPLIKDALALGLYCQIEHLLNT